MINRLIGVICFFVFSQLSLLAKVDSHKKDKKSAKFVCVDIVKVFTDSKEGKNLKEEITSKINEYQSFVKEVQEKLASLEKEVQEKEKILNADKLKEKKEVIEKERQKLGTEISQRQYVLNAEFQRKQEALRDRYLKEIQEMAEIEGWPAVLDKNSVLFTEREETDRVLQFIDKKYEEKLENLKKNKSSQKEKSKTLIT